MMALALQSVALAPALLPAALALRRRSPYDSIVPEKEGNGFSSLNYTGRRAAPCGYFFVCNASARLQWAAVAGRLRPAGFRVYRSANPAICRPPSFSSERRCNYYTRRFHA